MRQKGGLPGTPPPVVPDPESTGVRRDTAVAFVRKCVTVTVQTRSGQQRQFAVIQKLLGVP